MRWRVRAWGVLLAGLLTACSSTAPQAGSDQAVGRGATTTPARPTATVRATATPTTGVAATTATADGSVTPVMARLRIGGERYATLGDPNAPITMIEYTDFG